MVVNTDGIERGNRWSIFIWTGAAGLILLPFIAMRFTSEVNWTLSDFVFAGVMISGSCVVLELALRLTRSWAYRGAVALELSAIFLLVWVNGAVGIIGNEDNPLNLLYGCVIMTAIGGAVGAGAKARGMARASASAATIMMLVCLIVITSGRTDTAATIGYVALHTFFAMLFASAAALFHRAGSAPHEND